MILYTMKIITVLLQYYITGVWFINQMVPKHILKLEYCERSASILETMVGVL